MIDVHAVVRQWLTGTSAITTLAPANAIHYPDMPEASAPGKGEKHISFYVISGEDETETPILIRDFRVTAWADTALNATLVYRAIHDLMHWVAVHDGVRVDAGYIMNSRSIAPTEKLFRDPDTRWYGVEGYFEVKMRA